MLLDDIQGLILRGHGMEWARYFALGVRAPGAARKSLGALAPAAPPADGGNPSAPLQIATSADWTDRPDFNLNIGLTFAGLAALGLPPESLASFPEEFRMVTPERAVRIGDVGENAPANWLPEFRPDAPDAFAVHIIVTLMARTEAALSDASRRVREWMQEGGAFVEISAYDGRLLPGNRVHFGYTDGISQPQIIGAPPVRFSSPQPPVAAGEFVLGFDNENGFPYPVPQPDALGRNGSYAAFRIIQKHVVRFEAFLTEKAAQSGAPSGVDPREWLAANLCGRWRNGVPLALSPDTDAPPTPVDPAQYNLFDFGPGSGCPRGAHIRRTNPRSGRVAGGSPNSHRLVRRGVPYGPPYDPAHPDDGIERGLLGMFICASLKNQFEFMMSEWINGDSFGLQGDLDPLSAHNDPANGRFVLNRAEPPGEKIRLTGLPEFVTVRGGVYCFLPSVTALRFLASW